MPSFGFSLCVHAPRSRFASFAGPLFAAVAIVYAIVVVVVDCGLSVGLCRVVQGRALCVRCALLFVDVEVMVWCSRLLPSFAFICRRACFHQA
jgi:hypothetical protein